jgi:hypothetical protein
MKRLVTYYFLLLAYSNAFFALRPPLTITDDRLASLKHLFGDELPRLTEWFFQYPWWPRIGAVICIIGVVLSLLGKVKDSILRRLLVVFIIVELGVMFLFMLTSLMARC